MAVTCQQPWHRWYHHLAEIIIISSSSIFRFVLQYHENNGFHCNFPGIKSPQFLLAWIPYNDDSDVRVPELSTALLWDTGQVEWHFCYFLKNTSEDQLYKDMLKSGEVVF